MNPDYLSLGCKIMKCSDWLLTALYNKRFQENTSVKFIYKNQISLLVNKLTEVTAVI